MTEPRFQSAASPAPSAERAASFRAQPHERNDEPDGTCEADEEIPIDHAAMLLELAKNGQKKGPASEETGPI